MLILGVDTSTRSCSTAVLSQTGLLAEITLDNEQTHTRHVMGMVDHVLTLAGISLGDLDGFAVTRGPGSFTGLRIGLSTVKGLGQASGKPVVPLSSLEALAAQVPPLPMPIVAMIDAFRDEVYLAGYRYDDDRLDRITNETVVAPAKKLKMVPEPAIYVGSGAVAYRQELASQLGGHACIPAEPFHTIRGATVAALGMARLASHGRPAAKITPVYLRKSDAELHFK